VCIITIIICLTAASGYADGSEDIITILTEGKTNWFFTAEPVEDADLVTILQAGANTPSAINEQPWHFSVVTDPEIITELADTESTRQAPVMVLISVTSGNEMKLVDAGLACQSMQIAARALGYATKIETSAARTVRNDQSGDWAEMLSIPDGKTARVALFIGHEDETIDAVTSASARLSLEEVVSFVK